LTSARCSNAPADQDGRHVVLNTEAQGILARALNRNGGEWVFPNPETRRPYSRHYVGKVWRKAARAAGLTDFHFHDLRHHGATMALNAGFSAPIVMSLGGWKTERMMRRYAAVTDKTLRAAAETMSGVSDPPRLGTPLLSGQSRQDAVSYLNDGRVKRTTFVPRRHRARVANAVVPAFSILRQPLGRDVVSGIVPKPQWLFKLLCESANGKLHPIVGIVRERVWIIGVSGRSGCAVPSRSASTTQTYSPFAGLISAIAVCSGLRSRHHLPLGIRTPGFSLLRWWHMMSLPVDAAPSGPKAPEARPVEYLPVGS
jgi:hypothetical protein